VMGDEQLAEIADAFRTGLDAVANA
jgi:hypothetical protein